MSCEDIIKIIEAVNVPSEDDGRRFTVPDRRNKIAGLLKESPYEILRDGALAAVYGHTRFTGGGPRMLLTCHIDSVFSRHFLEDYGDDEILGTLDNSLCGGILVYSMMKGRLPPGVIVAFTGDEEEDLGGAKEAVEFLLNGKPDIWNNLELAMAMDITSEGYGTHDYTVENYSVEKDFPENSRLRFSSKKGFLEFLKKMFRNPALRAVSTQEADEDETTVFMEYDLNCFILCIPARPHPADAGLDAGDWMHSGNGCLARKSALAGCGRALEEFCANFFDHFAGPA